MTLTLYTIGHGNRPIEELIALLQEVGAQTLIDVRAMPRSRRNPQFNDDSLRQSCDRVGINYFWAGRRLGGKRLSRPGSPNVALEETRRGFADHMDTDVFQLGVVQLLNLAARTACALLCAERDPARCHRSLIADYLTLRGCRVVHLISSGATWMHELSPMARRESGALVYDRHVTGAFDWPFKFRYPG